MNLIAFRTFKVANVSSTLSIPFLYVATVSWQIFYESSGNSALELYYKEETPLEHEYNNELRTKKFLIKINLFSRYL